jgi:hypothetical protein
MPRTCTICTDVRITEVDELLVSGTPLRNIAEQFRLAATSLHRHRHAHLPATLTDARRAQEVVHADGLLDRLEGLNAEAHRLMDKAEREGDLRTSLAAVRELVRIVELMAKVTGELAPVTQTVNVALIPEWRVVMDRLGDFPDARVAVSRALEGTLVQEEVPVRERG